MSKRTAVALAALALAGTTAGQASANMSLPKVIGYFGWAPCTGPYDVSCTDNREYCTVYVNWSCSVGLPL